MIRIENLSFSYQRRRKVFSDLDLSFQKGHVYGLLGKNGAGKSTLLKLMAGLLFPKAGQIRVAGFIPAQRKPSFLSDFFFIPEEIYLPELKLRKYARLLAPFYPRFDFGALENMMEELEISDEVKMSNMSYGQRKKALIALGVACNTGILLLDEPTNGLDIPSKSSFRRIISSISTEERCVIISTHQVRDLENLIDAVVIIDESRILMNTTTDEITRHLRFKQLFADEKALFADESIKGRWGVVQNVTGEESKLDMELFFNAILKHPEQIKNIFESNN